MNKNLFLRASLVPAVGLVMALSACQQEQQIDAQDRDLSSDTTEETANTGTPSNPSASDTPVQESIENLGQASSDDRDKIVEDFGFSTADDSSAIESVQAEDQVYCLGKETNSQKTKEITPTQACGEISNRLASVSSKSCTAAKLQPTQCQSVSGFPILVTEFAPIEGRQPRGRILVIGGTHGDELTSVSIIFKWIEKLNLFHSGLFHWHVAPLLNPDGVLKRAASRTNQNGVDLNRNMPSDDWDLNALKYWEEKQDKNPRKYPGEQAASEPETQWLIDEINEFKPDAIISVHAPYGVVDFDSLVLNSAPKSLGKLTLNLLGTYPGSLGNYAGINRNIPVITLELPHAWDMPSDTETTQIWEDIVGWLRKNVGQDVATSEQKSL